MKSAWSWASLCGFEGEGDGAGDAFPLARLDLELLYAGFCEQIVLGFAVVVGRAPVGGKPTRVFETVEGGKERARPDFEGATGDLVDTTRHAEPMEFAQGECFEDQEIERALEEGGLCCGHFRGSPVGSRYEC